MNHIARETVIEADGRSYRLARLSRKLLAQWLDWADTQMVHPLDELKGRLADLPRDLADTLVREAIQQARLRKSLNNPAVQDLLHSTEGTIKLLELGFKVNHPDITEDEVFDFFLVVIAEKGEGYLQKQIAAAMGTLKLPDEGGSGAEKKG